MTHLTSENSKHIPILFYRLFGFIALSVTLLILHGCMTTSVSETKKFPVINAYIDRRLKFLRESGFDQVQMRAEPSSEGGKIVMCGSVVNKTAYEILFGFTTAHNFNPDLPAKIDWRVQIQSQTGKRSE